MSFPKSTLRTHAKATLPSVSSFGNNQSILKDPPKGQYTRQINKPQQTSSITTMIDESGDRFAEAIKLFPRGVDPMVAVQYNNSSRNAGTSAHIGIGTQASLPYGRVDDSFRPPIAFPQDLFPLSRLPRTTTSSFTKPGFADFSKKLWIPNQLDGKTIGARSNDQILRTSVRPTAVIKANVRVEEPYTTKNHIENRVKIEGFSGIRTMDGTMMQNGTSLDHIRDGMNVQAETNLSNPHTYNQPLEIDTSKFIQNPIHTSAQATFHFANGTNLDAISGQYNLTGHTPVYNVDTNVRGPVYTNDRGEQYQAPQMQNRPNAVGYTNHFAGPGVDTISDRSYELKQTTNRGGNYDMSSGYHMGYDYTNRSGMDSRSMNDEKAEMNRRRFEMQMARQI